MITVTSMVTGSWTGQTSVCIEIKVALLMYDLITTVRFEPWIVCKKVGRSTL